MDEKDVVRVIRLETAACVSYARRFMDELCWLNGTFLPLREARVSVEDRGFNFADGVYEVFRIYSGLAFAMDAHLDRLKRSCDGIELDGVAFESLPGVIEELIARSGLASAMIYLQITRGASPRYHSFPKKIDPTVMMSIRALPVPIEPGTGRGQKLISVNDDRWQRCWIKSIALLPNILAKHAADRVGADEAVFVDAEQVQEGSTSNLFIVRNRKLITAPIGPKVLPGITRQVILQIAASKSIEVEERSPTPDEALGADEVFIASTTREIAWVREWDAQVVGNGQIGPVTCGLEKALRDYIRESSRVSLNPSLSESPRSSASMA